MLICFKILSEIVAILMKITTGFLYWMCIGEGSLVVEKKYFKNLSDKIIHDRLVKKLRQTGKKPQV